MQLPHNETAERNHRLFSDTYIEYIYMEKL